MFGKPTICEDSKVILLRPTSSSCKLTLWALTIRILMELWPYVYWWSSDHMYTGGALTICILVELWPYVYWWSSDHTYTGGALTIRILLELWPYVYWWSSDHTYTGAKPPFNLISISYQTEHNKTFYSDLSLCKGEKKIKVLEAGYKITKSCKLPYQNILSTATQFFMSLSFRYEYDLGSFSERPEPPVIGYTFVLCYWK